MKKILILATMFLMGGCLYVPEEDLDTMNDEIEILTEENEALTEENEELIDRNQELEAEVERLTEIIENAECEFEMGNYSLGMDYLFEL